jgi:hypothetical protein
MEPISGHINDPLPSKPAGRGQRSLTHFDVVLTHFGVV